MYHTDTNTHFKSRNRNLQPNNDLIKVGPKFPNTVPDGSLPSPCQAPKPTLIFQIPSKKKRVKPCMKKPYSISEAHAAFMEKEPNSATNKSWWICVVPRYELGMEQLYWLCQEGDHSQHPGKSCRLQGVSKPQKLGALE